MVTLKEMSTSQPLEPVNVNLFEKRSLQMYYIIKDLEVRMFWIIPRTLSPMTSILTKEEKTQTHRGHVKTEAAME